MAIQQFLDVLPGRAGFHRGAIMKRHILFILLLFSTYLLSGTSWIRSYPWLDVCPYQYDSAQARAYNVIPAIGGGYLLQGHAGFYNTDSYVMEKNVFWKIEDNGDMIWRRLGYDSDPYNVVVSNGVDRYYCIATFELYTAMDVFDSQINLLGHYQFNQVNGFNANLSDAVLTSDGLVFAAKVGGNAVILKTDFEFNLIWQGEGVSTGWGDGYYTVRPYSGGWVAGSTRHFAYMTAIGDTLWTYFGPDNPIAFNDCLVTNDNRIVCTGLTSYMNAGHLFLYEIDVVNHVVNRVTDGVQYGFSEALESMIEASTGNIIVLCYATNNTVLHAYNPAGDHLWSRDFSPNLFYFLGEGRNNLMASTDGGILFCTMGNGGITLVKTDSNGNVVSNNDPINAQTAIRTYHYPNPARTHLTIEYKTDGREMDLNLEIFNLRGQMVYGRPLTGTDGSHHIDLIDQSGNMLTPGVYFYRVSDGQRAISSHKFVIIN